MSADLRFVPAPVSWDENRYSSRYIAVPNIIKEHKKPTAKALFVIMIWKSQLFVEQ